MTALTPSICRKARLARDPRFDGLFFLAVATTGIYCRPICPARPPREDNVSYYPSAAAAAAQGFRPCLRCRPESAPESPAWQGTSTTVNRALQLINQGALNHGGLSTLAERLGIGERYLRKLFQQQVGTSPTAVAHTRRLHFARKLLLETALPITDIAFASGFSSVRRFNAAIREQHQCTPGELRKRSRKRPSGDRLTLELSYRPPLDWPGLLDFFQRHAIPELEWVEDNRYHRKFVTDRSAGTLTLRPAAKGHALELTLLLDSTADLLEIVARVRRMFDLDADPAHINAGLRDCPTLGPLLKQTPGIRSPVYWSEFEAAVRAIAGQQVSLKAAAGVCSHLLNACHAEHATTSRFPTPAQVATVGDSALRMPSSRRDTLRAVCAQFTGGAPELDWVQTQFTATRGIGPWTRDMLLMRGYADPDVFPGGDLILKRALATASASETHTHEHWRPWGSYAANLIWRHLA